MTSDFGEKRGPRTFRAGKTGGQRPADPDFRAEMRGHDPIGSGRTPLFTGGVADGYALRGVLSTGPREPGVIGERHPRGSGRLLRGR